MEYIILNKIKTDDKAYMYLLHNSYWFRLLNRDSNNYDKFIKEYKKYKREVSINKINEAIDNAEIISNVVKIMQ